MTVSLFPSSDSCVENDSLSLLDKTLDDQADTASIRSRGSVHSVGSSGDQQQKGVAMPRLEPFSPGQVFNHSHTRQVLVLPATDDHIMEVNATWPWWRDHQPPSYRTEPKPWTDSIELLLWGISGPWVHVEDRYRSPGWTHPLSMKRSQHWRH